VYALQDANWNTTAIIAATGVPGVSAAAVINRFAYTPYGEVKTLTASWATPPARSTPATPWAHLFQGLEFTEVTGLAYVRHRDYSATLGRFIELDPIGFSAGDNNWYRFVANGPTGKVDPSGLQIIVSGGNSIPTVIPPNGQPYIPPLPPPAHSWSFSAPSISWVAGQSASVKGCWPIGPAVWVCLTGGWNVTVGRCCDRGQSREYFKTSFSLTGTFEVSQNMPGSISLLLPQRENLSACPKEGWSGAVTIEVSGRVGPLHGQCKIPLFPGSSVVCTGSFSPNNFLRTWDVAVTGGVRGSAVFAQLGKTVR
jgi:RHS repeat-associated protein